MSVSEFETPFVGPQNSQGPLRRSDKMDMKKRNGWYVTDYSVPTIISAVFEVKTISWFVLHSFASMSCPCGLSQERVLEVAEKHGVPLVGGLCQNPFTKSDGSLGICGKPLGDHRLAQGNTHFLVSLNDFMLIYHFDVISISFPFSLRWFHGDCSRLVLSDCAFCSICSDHFFRLFNRCCHWEW